MNGYSRVFECLKAALPSSSVLAHYDPKSPLGLACDASTVGLEAVIFHITPQGYKPIAFASKTLTPSEFAYAHIEREVLVIIIGSKRFINTYMANNFHYILIINH